MNSDLKKNLLNADTYKRLAFMIIFTIIYGIVELVVYAVAIAQFLVLLVKGNYHDELKSLGRSVSDYIYDIVKFLTFDTEHLPFPFEPWKYSKENIEDTQTVDTTTQTKSSKSTNDDEEHA